MLSSYRPKVTRGSSLIEVLVVIVIFLVGILGLTQIFPRGLGILVATRDASVATQLSSSEMERVRSLGDQLPDGVLPAIYNPTTGAYDLNLNQPSTELIPAGATLARDGTLSLNGTPAGYWQRFVGANVNRKVIGEGKKVPAPRFVQTTSGQILGSVLTLTFGPVISRVNAGTGLDDGISVYGNDLNKQYLDDDQNVPNRFFDYTTYISSGTVIYLPSGTTRTRHFRVLVSYTATDGSTQTTLIPDVAVAATSTPQLNAYDITSSAPNAQYIQFDTVRVQRLFEQLLNPTTFITQANIAATPSLIDDAAYQYVVLDKNIGTLMFNPAGYNYQELRGRARTPLAARVDYDVLDWRILREDFRIPTSASIAEQRLAVQAVKVRGNQDVDGTKYAGIGITPLGVTSPDLVIVDTDTGAVIGDDAYKVEKSLGRITFNSYAATLYYPDGSTQAITDVRGRSLRALYQAPKSFSVQVIKAASNYIPISSPTLGFQQCYIGGTDTAADGDPQNVYFALSDVGKRVIVGDMWYTNGGAPIHLQDQEFEIRPPKGALNMGYIDVREKDASATGLVNFGTTGLLPVQRVRGASLNVRVLWNPTSLYLTTDPVANMSRLDVYLRSTRRLDTENIVVRGVTQ